MGAREKFGIVRRDQQRDRVVDKGLSAEQNHPKAASGLLASLMEYLVEYLVVIAEMVAFGALESVRAGMGLRTVGSPAGID